LQRVLVALLIAALQLHPAKVTAQESNAAPLEPPILEWLKSGRYASVDQRLASLQSGYEAGATSEEELYKGFRALYNDGADNRAYFDRWVRLFPNSYAARLARGIFWYRVGCCWRGNHRALLSSDADRWRVAKYVPLARIDLTASLTMTRKPYLSAYYLLNAALLDSPPEVRRHWLEVGNNLHPDNALLRARYMDGLTPEFGGSLELMRDFRNESAQQLVPDRVLARLDVKLHRETGEQLWRSGSPQQLFDEWRQVLERAPAAGEEPDPETLIGYARSAWALHRRADADRALERLAHLEVGEAWILSSMGYIYVGEERMPEAWAVLQKAAMLNDPWAQLAVGKTLYFGCADIDLGADQEAGLVWVRRSAAQGDTEARDFLDQSPWERTVNEKFAWISKHLQ
jgi:hypothetical protein